MQNLSSPARNEACGTDGAHIEDDTASPVSWPAIFAGTFTVLALSFILIGFGAGLGFASVSPWQHEGISAIHFTYAAAVWLIVVQWISSGLGGYLTGRLRTQWVGVHTHEVFFRDTAHGFLTWTVATVVSAIILLFAASSALGGHAHMTGAANLMQAKSQNSTMYKGHSADTSSYDVDSLLRGDHPGAAVDQDAKEEAAHILTKGLKDGFLSDSDKTYLAELVSAHTGLTLPDAEKKVDAIMAEIRESADEARKTAASVSIYTFLSMLIGAFIASAAAALGGQQRDKPYPHSTN
jgi:hypothetical protein